MIINSRYQIIDQIGEGGMGTIYLASDLLLPGNNVVIKTIRSKFMEAASKTALADFKKEYQVMTRLYHPNLVKVFDFAKNQDNGDYFIVMEYLKGKTLRAILRERKTVSLEDTLQIITELCRAFEFIHSKGIIYRDIKPENVMIIFGDNDSIKSVKLLDFGLADNDAKNEVVVKGTLLYLAPEALNSQVDQRSDIFGLGILFYELLSGGFIYSDSSKSTILKSLSSINIFKEKIFKSLDNLNNNEANFIISKMTAYNRDKRYANCSDVITDINKFFSKKFALETHLTKEAYLHGFDFVGREEETNWLKQKLAEHNSALFLVSGQAGIGKSRLFTDFQKYCKLNDQLFFKVVFNEQNTTNYQSLHQLLAEILSICPPEICAKYATKLKKVIPDSIFFQDITAIWGDDPQIEKNIILQALCNFLIDFSQSIENNLIIFFDNLEFAEESVLTLIEELLYKANNSDQKDKLLLFSAIREEEEERVSVFTGKLTAKNRLEKLNIPSLEPQEITALIKNIFGQNSIHKSFSQALDLISTQVNYNPLFLIEYLKNLIDKNYLNRKNGLWTLTNQINTVKLPENIDYIIIAKLKRLNLNKEDKKLLNIITLLSSTFCTVKFLEEFGLPGLKSLLALLIKHEIITIKEGFILFSCHTYSKVIKQNMSESEKEKISRLIILNLEKHFSFDYNNANQNENQLFEIAANYLRIAKFSQKELKTKTIPVLRAAGSKYKYNDSYKSAQKVYQAIINLLEPYKSDIFFNDELLRAQISLGAVYVSINKYKEGEQIIQASLKSSQESHNAKQTAFALMWLGKLYTFTCEYSKSADCFENALKLYKDDKDILNQIMILLSLGNLYRRISQVDRAEETFLETLQLSESMNNFDGICQCYIFLGTIETIRRNYTKADEFYKKASEVIEKIVNKRIKSIFLNNYATLCMNLDRYDEAYKYLQQDFQISEETGLKYDIGICLANISLYYLKNKNYLKSMEIGFRRIKLAEELNDKDGLAISLANIGNAYRNMGGIKKSIEYHTKSLQIRQELKNENGCITNHANLFFGYMDLKEYDLAKEHAQKVSDIADNMNSPIYKIMSLRYLGEIHKSLCQYAESEKFLTEAILKAKQIDHKLEILYGLLVLSNVYYLTNRYDQVYSSLKEVFLETKTNNSFPDFLFQAILLNVKALLKQARFGEASQNINEFKNYFKINPEYNSVIDGYELLVKINEEIDKSTKCSLPVISEIKKISAKYPDSLLAKAHLHFEIWNLLVDNKTNLKNEIEFCKQEALRYLKELHKAKPSIDHRLMIEKLEN